VGRRVLCFAVDGSVLYGQNVDLIIVKSCYVSSLCTMIVELWATRNWV